MRQLPALTIENTFFWQSGSDGTLRFLRCGACRYWLHPPGPVCPECGSGELEPEATSGRAAVVTFTVNHQAWRPDVEVPYAVAIVELPEQAGIRLTTNIVDCALDDISIGMPVEVTFLHQEDVWLPLFRPVTA